MLPHSAGVGDRQLQSATPQSDTAGRDLIRLPSKIVPFCFCIAMSLIGPSRPRRPVGFESVVGGLAAAPTSMAAEARLTLTGRRRASPLWPCGCDRGVGEANRLARALHRRSALCQLILQPSRQLPFGTLGQVSHYVGRDGLARLPQLIKHRSGRHVALMHVSTDRVIHQQPRVHGTDLRPGTEVSKRVSQRVRAVIKMTILHLFDVPAPAARLGNTQGRQCSKSHRILPARRTRSNERIMGGVRGHRNVLASPPLGAGIST